MEERLSFRDRVSALSRRELVALVGVAVVIVAGAGLWYARSLPKQVEVAQEPGAVPPPAASASAPAPTGLGAAPVASAASGLPVASPVPTVLYVHVAGLVKRPGVYEFHSGDRIVDAVTAAGGAKAKADLDLLNLASPLVDGEQILVPAHGQAVVAPAAPAVPGVPVGTAPAVPGTSGGLVNINTATETELEELPGVGPVTANEIVAYRTEHGPFPSVDSLDDVSGIGPATMEQLRPLVTV
jgi:competence protein ComEA